MGQQYCACCEKPLGYIALLDVHRRVYERAPASRQGEYSAIIKAFACINDACEYRGLRIDEIEWDGLSWKRKTI